MDRMDTPKHTQTRQKVETFLDPDTIEKIDTIRGPAPRSAYLRTLIEFSLAGSSVGEGGRIEKHRHRWTKTGLVLAHEKGSPIHIQWCPECHDLRAEVK